MSQLWVNPEDLGLTNPTETALATEAAKSASYILWALSGRKFSGVTTVTERYAKEAYLDPYGPVVGMSSSNTKPVSVAGGLTNQTSATAARLRLRGRPVQRILSVRTPDGTVLSPDSYYLTEHAILNFYDLAVPYDIEVTYTYGAPPPMAGQMAAKQLAKEFILAWTDDENCALPQRVTSVSRQGISFTILDNQDFIADLRTGVYLVDLFLKSANPDKARARARVFSPDKPRGRRYTPKPVQIAPSDSDIEVKGPQGVVTIDLADIDAEFLLVGTWDLELIVRSWGGTRSLTIPGAATLNVGPETLTIVVPYSEALSVLGVADPGTWDLYATSGSSTTHVVSGNIELVRAA